MKKPDVTDLSFDELTEYLGSIGQPLFRATQIFEWIYQRCVFDFDKMSNLSNELRIILNKKFTFTQPHVLQKEVSTDGTTKILFELHDKEKIETVLIPTSTRATVCVSTQAGCKFGCRFCASGIGGWKRNLTSSEILNQILYMKALAGKRPWRIFSGTPLPK